MIRKKERTNRNNSQKTEKSKPRAKGKRIGIVILCILVVLGIAGGTLLKQGFFGESEDYFMANAEANRLIRYLGINEFQYLDRLGSSFTVGNARELMDAAGVSYDKLEFSIDYKPGFLPITKRQFESMYGVIVEALELDRLSKKNMYIYDVDYSYDMEVDGVVYVEVSSNEGDYYVEKDYGFPSEYINKVVNVYVSNNEIILCMGESDEEVQLKNAYITKIDDNNGKSYAVTYINSDRHELLIRGDVNESMTLKDCLCDISITNKGIVKVTDHTDSLVTAKVQAYTDGLLTVDGYSDQLVLSEYFNAYKIKGAFKAMQSAGTLIGYDNVSLLISDNVVEAAIVQEDIRSKNIRVLISNSDYTSYYHGEVAITSDTDYTVSYGDNIVEHKAGDRLLFSNGSDELKTGSARIESKTEGGKITLSLLERQSGTPSYRGAIELTRNDKGVLIVNELPVEQYLYGVVPSEMPVSYEMEALKAQAICARAYSYRQMESDKYVEYGAHLDDSISSQVYNNVAEDERAIYAVDDTYGVVPCYNDEVIEAFFFSTSCGATANNSSVWGDNQEPYLLDTYETELNDLANLSDEGNFKDFIDGKLGIDYIEENEPFFRWNVSVSEEEMQNTINDNLYDRIQAMPEYILAKTSSGSFDKKSINTIGDLESIEVTKRGSSGIIEEMIITGSAETIKVTGQTNARYLLCPKNVEIHKQDGSVITGWNTLPSAFFYVESGDTYIIRGGGFGHGVGLSQNGANDMAKLGYAATDIISHYYTGIELKDMYRLMGE